MEQSGGAMAAKRAKPSAAAGEDRLSSLPDEVLVLILLRLGTAAAAGRTSGVEMLALQWLIVCGCFVGCQPVANISTPQLRYLSWNEPYDPSSVKLGNLGQVRRLGTNYYLVYGRQDSRTNRAFLLLLGRFPVIRSLQTKLVYPMVSSHAFLLE